MAKYPGARWRGPIPNMTPGGMTGHVGLLLHIECGTEDGSDAWFRNPEAQASAHFGNPKTGPVDQWVDTDDRAWHAVAANRTWIGIEHEGQPGDSLTPSQLENVAKLYAWLHQQYGIPLQSTDDPNGSGLGWHGMGGEAFGGHFDCPGQPIKDARPQILARVAQILGQNAPAPTPAPQPSYPAWPGEYLRVQSPMLHDDAVRTWQQRMADRGWSITVDGWYGSASASICRQFQQDKGLTVDGIVGPVTWQAGWTAPIT